MPKGRVSNYIGMRFGRLQVVSLSARDSKHGRYWLCVCACGNKEKKEVRGDNLASGKTVSCGCYLKDVQQGQVSGKRVGRPVVDDRLDEDLHYQAMMDF